MVFLFYKVKRWLSSLPAVPASRDNSTVKRKLVFSPTEKVKLTQFGMFFDRQPPFGFYRQSCFQRVSKMCALTGDLLPVF